MQLLSLSLLYKAFISVPNISPFLDRQILVNLKVKCQRLPLQLGPPRDLVLQVSQTLKLVGLAFLQVSQTLKRVGKLDGVDAAMQPILGCDPSLNDSAMPSRAGLDVSNDTSNSAGSTSSTMHNQSGPKIGRGIYGYRNKMQFTFSNVCWEPNEVLAGADAAQCFSLTVAKDQIMGFASQPQMRQISSASQHSWRGDKQLVGAMRIWHVACKL